MRFVWCWLQIPWRWRMTNQERLALADRVQKNIQKKFIEFQFDRRKKQIEKEFQFDDHARKSWLKVSFLSDFFIAVLNLAEAVGREIDKFFRQSFGNNRIGMKLFHQLFVIGLDFLVGRFGRAV